MGKLVEFASFCRRAEAMEGLRPRHKPPTEAYQSVWSTHEDGLHDGEIHLKKYKYHGQLKQGGKTHDNF